MQVDRGSWGLERQRKGHIRKGRWRRFWEEYCCDWLLMWIEGGKRVGETMEDPDCCSAGVMPALHSH